MNSTNANQTNQPSGSEPHPSRLILEHFPAGPLRAARRRLACAAFWALDGAAVTGVIAFYSWTGAVPDWLDAHGGKLSWLVFGALAWHVLFELWPQTLRDLSTALDEWREARQVEREALALPLSARFTFIEHTPGIGTTWLGVEPPAGWRIPRSCEADPGGSWEERP